MRLTVFKVKATTLIMVTVFKVKVLALAAILVLMGVASAHIHDRSDLDDWAKSLNNAGGIPCCDNQEASPVADPDWKVDASGRFAVRLEGAWEEVPDSAIVHVNNRYGPTLVWYTAYGGQVYIRCFLPGAGA